MSGATTETTAAAGSPPRRLTVAEVARWCYASDAIRCCLLGAARPLTDWDLLPAAQQQQWVRAVTAALDHPFDAPVNIYAKFHGGRVSEWLDLPVSERIRYIALTHLARTIKPLVEVGQ